jgi:predicted TIM-barrel fold metal-dependent hydrolase
MAYKGPAIDTHHHIWLRKDVAWLADPPIPRMFGDYFGIRRDYPVEEFINDVKPQGVTKSVHVTAMWGPGHALASIRRRQAWISARNRLQCGSRGSRRRNGAESAKTIP